MSFAEGEKGMAAARAVVVKRRRELIETIVAVMLMRTEFFWV